jgi:PadR family transcriptional regulator PadR
MAPELAKGHLDLLVLSALAETPAHGYAIIETIRRKSAAVFDLPEGSVYPALHRLERDGLITSSWSEGASRRRRTYRLTRAGRAHLNSERSEFRAFTKAVRAVTGT